MEKDVAAGGCETKSVHVQRAVRATARTSIIRIGLKTFMEDVGTKVAEAPQALSESGFRRSSWWLVWARAGTRAHVHPRVKLPSHLLLGDINLAATEVSQRDVSNAVVSLTHDCRVFCWGSSGVKKVEFESKEQKGSCVWSCRESGTGI